MPIKVDFNDYEPLLQYQPDYATLLTSLQNQLLGSDLGILQSISPPAATAGVEYALVPRSVWKIWSPILNTTHGDAGHYAGAFADRYAPTRNVKGTQPSPGTTKATTAKEMLGILAAVPGLRAVGRTLGNRLDVKAGFKPGEFGLQFIIACRNQALKTKFTNCRQRFATAANRGQLAFTTKNHGGVAGLAGTPLGDVPSDFLLDGETGECWMFQGQPVDITYKILKDGMHTVHCDKGPNVASPDYGALGRGTYLTPSFSKACLYTYNVVNQYHGATKGSDVRVLMLVRALMGDAKDYALASDEEKKDLRGAHNLELRTYSSSNMGNNPIQVRDHMRTTYRDAKLNAARKNKLWSTQYGWSGSSDDSKIGYQSISTIDQKGKREFLVSGGSQLYPEFLAVFTKA